MLMADSKYTLHYLNRNNMQLWNSSNCAIASFGFDTCACVHASPKYEVGGKKLYVCGFFETARGET
jgi:hypothetical protein